MSKRIYRFLTSILIVCIILNSVHGLALPAKATGSNYVMVDIPWNYIQSCGNQVSSGNKKACQAYAFTYCRIILDNTAYSWTEYRYGTSGQTACAPATAGYNSCTNTTSEQAILKAIYDNINLGRPVMLRAKGSQLFHYVVAIGYKADCNPSKLSQSDIIILDPWDGTQKSLTQVPLKKTSAGNYGYWTAKNGGTAVINNSRTYTVTFDGNGGGLFVESISVKPGGKYGPLAAPYREGYDFDGWYTERVGGTEVYSSTTVNRSNDHTLYAHWTPISVTVSFDAKGGTVSPGSKVVTYDARYGALPIPTRSGYTFTGWWYDDGDIGLCLKVTESSTVAISENTTLYATWAKNSEDSDSPDEPECTKHVKGNLLYSDNIHPHYKYYSCANCKKTFTEHETVANVDCDSCWGNWSSWSTSSVTATPTRQVETRQVKVTDAYTQYRYGRYIDSTGTHDCWCPKYFKNLPYISGNVTLQYSNWTTTRYGTNGKGWTCGYCSGTHIGVDHTDSNGKDWWGEYILPDGSYYWEETRTVQAVYRTEYRYRELIGPQVSTTPPSFLAP